ncbi:MAG: TIGR04255 family protein [Planctomycetes bacterium]|nr:TIGR04255 family protein [Planctomycetota bacterium]MCC7173357.1 TIGR04255 family protein [Planctomycetota bacterium]
MNTSLDPFASTPVIEVPLVDPPLERVIAQVRFGSVLSIGEMVRGFQESIRDEYPILDPESVELTVRVNGGIVDRKSKTIWRFSNGDGTWRASLTDDFIALETLKYTSRDGFVARIERLLIALREHVHPQFAERIGVRFVDRLHGEDVQRVPEYVRSEVRGIIGSELAPRVHGTMTQTRFELPDDEGVLFTRSGLLAIDDTYDPSAIRPVDHPTWLLDIDAFTERREELDPKAVASRVRMLATRIYAMFRWSVTDQMLRRFGGAP